MVGSPGRSAGSHSGVRAYGGRSCSRQPLSPCPAARPVVRWCVRACTVCQQPRSLARALFFAARSGRLHAQKKKNSAQQLSSIGSFLRVQVRNQTKTSQGQDTNTTTPEPTDVRKTVDCFVRCQYPRPRTYPAMTRSTLYMHDKGYHIAS
jgi:hypothetical protein